MRSVKPILLLLMLLPLLATSLLGCKPGDGNRTASGGQKYHCPMHPTYVSDRPGDCPICNMRLVPIENHASGKADSVAHPARAAATTNATDYYCTMCPEVSTNAPGLCPVCNMNLIARQVETGATAPGAVPGRMGIHVSPEKRQMIGLTLSKVEKRELTRTIRTTAVVQHDETLYTRVAPRFSGWVRQLHVNFTGAPVEKGAPLFSAYSPDLFAAENEYLVAFRAAGSPTGITPGSTNAAPRASLKPPQGAPLLQSARTRLHLLEVSDEQIRELEERGAASAEMLFRAPFSGHVLQKNAVQGQAFNSGDTLFEIADLSRVWLRTAIYEYEFPLVQVGQHATIHFPNLQHTTEATVTFIYPHFDPQTRRGEVRLELQNPNHLYRPDMWANVEIEIPLGEKLAVPASAVLDTGVRQIAFVQGNEQHLEPRVLTLGAKTSDYYEVISGLAEGEQVVTRALFLIDSESQLKSAIAGMLPTPASSPELPHTNPETSTKDPPATPPAATPQHQH